MYQCITNNGTTQLTTQLKITYSFFVLQTCDVDIDKVAGEGQSSPFILVTSTPGEEKSLTVLW